MSGINEGPQGTHDSVLEIHAGEAAYIVHLIRTNTTSTANWDPRRRLSLAEARAFADRLEKCLPAETRRKLARLHRTNAA